MSSVNTFADQHSVKRFGDHPVIMLRPSRYDLDVDPVALSPGHYVIGSGSDCNIALDFEGIAEKHCRLIVSPKKTVIQAMSPLTWVNDGGVVEETLLTGDDLILGPIEFVVSTFEAQKHTPPPLPEQPKPEPQPTNPDFGQMLWQFMEVAMANARNPSNPGNATPSPPQNPPTQANSYQDDDFEVESEVRFLDVQRAELEQEQADLAERKRELQREIHKLDQLRARVEETEASFSQREHELNQRSEELKNQSQIHENRLEELKAQQSDLRARQCEFEELEQHRAELDAQRLEIESNRIELNAYSDELEQRSSQLAAHVTELKTERRQLQEEIDSQETEKASLAEESHAEQSAKTERATNQLDELKTEIAELCDTLAARQSELESVHRAVEEQSQRKIELDGQAAIIASQSAEIDEKLELLANEESLLNRQRENLSQQAAEIERRRQEIDQREIAVAEHEKQIDHLSAQIEVSTKDEPGDVSESIDTTQQERIQSLIEQAANERHQLEQDRLQLAEIEKSLDSKLAELDVDTITLQQIEDSLGEQESLLQAELDTLQADRESFEKEQEKLRELAADLHEWENELDLREDELEAIERQGKLIAPAEQANDQQLALQELEAQKQEVDLARQNVETATAELQLQSEEIVRKQREIDKILANLSTEKSEFQRRLSELEDRERELTEAENKVRLEDLERSEDRKQTNDDWDETWSEFDLSDSEKPQRKEPAESAEILQELESLKSEMSLLVAERDELSEKLQEQRKRFQDLSEERAEIARKQLELKQLAGPLEELKNDLETKELDLCEDREEIHKRLLEVKRYEELLSDGWDRLKQEQEEFAAQKSKFEATGTQTSTRSNVESAHSGQVEEIRAQLAELIQTTSATSSDFENEAPAQQTIDEPLDSQSGGEVSVDDYMERLLARTQSGAKFSQSQYVKQQTTPSTSSKQSPPPSSNSPDVKDREPVNRDQIMTPSPRRTEKPALGFGEDEMRAKLDSFRAVANMSAREAVSKSIAEREQARFKTLWIGTLLCWTLTLVMVGWIIEAGASILTILAAGGSLGASLMMTVGLGIALWAARDAAKKAKSEDSSDSTE